MDNLFSEKMNENPSFNGKLQFSLHPSSLVCSQSVYKFLVTTWGFLITLHLGTLLTLESWLFKELVDECIPRIFIVDRCFFFLVIVWSQHFFSRIIPERQKCCKLFYTPLNISASFSIRVQNLWSSLPFYLFAPSSCDVLTANSQPWYIHSNVPVAPSYVSFSDLSWSTLPRFSSRISNLNKSNSPWYFSVRIYFSACKSKKKNRKLPVTVERIEILLSFLLCTTIALIADDLLGLKSKRCVSSLLACLYRSVEMGVQPMFFPVLTHAWLFSEIQFFPHVCWLSKTVTKHFHVLSFWKPVLLELSDSCGLLTTFWFS